MDTNLRSPTKRRWPQVLLIVAGSIPFLCSLGFHAVGSSVNKPRASADRPALAFDQYMVNLRHVLPKPTIYARFSFQNSGDHTVRITELKPSCGCLNPRLDKRVYKPGESGAFFLRVSTPNEEPGPKEYTVKVIYEDPKPRETEVTFKVVLPERTVVVRPRALIFYQLSDQPTIREIFISDYRNSDMKITQVSSSSEFVVAKKIQADRDADGFRRLRVVVTVAAKVPSGKSQATVTIRTDDPEYPRLQVPILIQGPASNIVPTGFESPNGRSQSG